MVVFLVCFVILFALFLTIHLASYRGGRLLAECLLKDVRSEDRTAPGHLRPANILDKGSTYNKIGKI